MIPGRPLTSRELVIAVILGAGGTGNWADAGGPDREQLTGGTLTTGLLDGDGAAGGPFIAEDLGTPGGPFIAEECGTAITVNCVASGGPPTGDWLSRVAADRATDVRRTDETVDRLNCCTELDSPYLHKS